jgi:hypothetical protein
MNNFNFSYFSFSEVFKSLLSVIVINILILYSKLNKKKTIFFYHPRKLATGIHTFYIEDLFKDYHQNFVLVYGHISKKKLGKNYFYIKEGYLRFLLNVNIFITTNVCDKFINNSIKVYLNHHIYDSPLVNFEKEQKLCEKFSSYDVILLPSQNLIKLFKEMFIRYKDSPKIKLPILKEIGYPKFDFLEKKIKKNIKSQINNILISPTGIHGYPDFTIIDNLKDLINELICKTNFNIIFRPHPLNRHDPKILQITEFFETNAKFHYDTSEDYSSIYSKSMCLLTDQSDTAYMFAFLTMRPVVFFSNKNLDNFINTKEEKTKLYNYRNLNYFINREKIGIIINQDTRISEKINKLSHELKKYELSISEIKKDIKYLGQSKKRFDDEINNLIFDRRKFC